MTYRWNVSKCLHYIVFTVRKNHKRTNTMSNSGLHMWLLYAFSAQPLNTVCSILFTTCESVINFAVPAFYDFFFLRHIRTKLHAKREFYNCRHATLLITCTLPRQMPSLHTYKFMNAPFTAFAAALYCLLMRQSLCSTHICTYYKKTYLFFTLILFIKCIMCATHKHYARL